MLGRHDLDNGRPIDDFFAFKDNNPQAKKEEQYKAISNVSWKIWGGGIWGFASPDGIHWKRIQDTPLFTDRKEYDAKVLLAGIHIVKSIMHTSGAGQSTKEKKLKAT